MSDRQTADIRNVAVVGHGGAGKTTLVENLLAEAGAVPEPGDVEEGSSRSDYGPEEKERGFSIDNSMFHFDWNDISVNLIDTPGYIEFVGTATSALPAVETALVTIDATEGIQINTRQMWERAGELGKARALVITHLDGENIRYQDLIDEIQDVFGRQCAPLFLPVGLGEEVSGVVDLLSADEAPDGVVGDFSGLQEELVESVIESDEELMERYLEGEEIEDQRLRRAFREAIAAGEVAPVLCCCAPQQVGLEETLRFMADCLPSPLDVSAPVAQDEEGNEVDVEQEADAPLCAWVFKSFTDVHVGKLGFFRVFGGTVERGQDVQIARTGDTARMGHIYHVFGEEQEEAEQATPGDILCMSKVEEVELNDTLCSPEQKLFLPAPKEPNTMVSLAVTPESREDEEKMGEGLEELVGRDPGLSLRRDERSSELVLSGLSNLHLEVTLSRLKRQYDVEVTTRPPTIPYQETITERAKGHHRHKKQSGGRGQYGEVYLVIEPLERGEGFEFLDETKGGVIPRQFLPSVEKGIKEAMDDGLMADFPVVDLRVRVYDGDHHSVDSSEAAFKTAGAKAFEKAFNGAEPTLLEPISEMEVTIPAEYMGDVTANLTGHRGRIQGMDQEGETQTVRAQIPMAEVSTYGAELKSITGGEGTFTVEFSHYEPVPSHMQDEVIRKERAKRKEDE